MTADTPRPGSIRARLTAIVDAAFGATLAISFIAGIALVVGQLVGLVVGAGGLVSALPPVLGAVAAACAAAAGLLSLVAMYLHRWGVTE